VLARSGLSPIQKERSVSEDSDQLFKFEN